MSIRKQTPQQYEKVRVIANPSAGKAPSGEDSDLAAALKRNGIHVDAISIPRDAAHTESIARECAAAGYDAVIGVGGDGTINAVMNGLVGTNTALGVIPAGTANVFAHHLGMPMGMEEACEAFTRGEEVQMDVGKINDRHFGCTSGVGFDAYVMRRVGGLSKRFAGMGAYLFYGARSLLTYPFRKVFLTIEDNPTVHSGYLVIVNNSRFYGGDFVIAPNASVVDGLLDIIIFKNRDIASIMRYLISAKSGTTGSAPGMECLQARYGQIDGRGRHPVHVDGEPYGRAPVKFSVVPRGLRAISCAI